MTSRYFTPVTCNCGQIVGTAWAVLANVNVRELPRCPTRLFRTAGADYSNVKAAEMICDVFHNGGGPQDIPFLGLQQNQYRDVIIDGARRFMCPDTLH
jgi:hypothetical protein